MLYTELTKKALRIAFDAHKEQTDKIGLPYIYHPIHLAEQMKDEATICVALLHDVVEDGNVSFEYLRESGFTEEIVSAVSLLTHDENVPYMEYVKKISTNPIAKTVKLADLKHNSDLSRLPIIDEKALIRYKKYQDAFKLLQEGQLPMEQILDKTAGVLTKNNTEHQMNLHAMPYDMIKSGQKTIELRLNDEKRQKIKVGDTIVFTNTSNGKKLSKKVKNLYHFENFEKLYQALPLKKCGYTCNNISAAQANDMTKYYSVDEQEKYGVIGIELSD